MIKESCNLIGQEHILANNLNFCEVTYGKNPFEESFLMN